MNVQGVEITLLDAEIASIELIVAVLDKYSNHDVGVAYILGIIYLIARIVYWGYSRYRKLKESKEDREHILMMREKEVTKWNELFEKKKITSQEIEQVMKDPVKLRSFIKKILK